MLIPQYQVLLLKLSPIYTVSLNTVFSIPQNQWYPGIPCSTVSFVWQFFKEFSLSFVLNAFSNMFCKSLNATLYLDIKLCRLLQHEWCIQTTLIEIIWSNYSSPSNIVPGFALREHINATSKYWDQNQTE